MEKQLMRSDQREPQIGIEPMTASLLISEACGASLCQQSSSEQNTAQDRPESAPNRRESGNEVATAVRASRPAA